MVYVYIYTHVYTPFIWINIGSQGAGMFTLIFIETVPFAVCLSAPLNRDVIILSYSIHLPKDCWCSENKNFTGSWWTRRTF